MLVQILVRSLHPGFEERIKPLRDGLLTLIPVHASHVGLYTVLEEPPNSKGCLYLEYIRFKSYYGSERRHKHMAATLPCVLAESLRLRA
jgi:hypothetical protein